MAGGCTPYWPGGFMMVIITNIILTFFFPARNKLYLFLIKCNQWKL